MRRLDEDDQRAWLLERAADEDAQRSLLSFLDHPEVGVRGWAAAHALEFAPEAGEPTLIELARAPGISGVAAEMTLEVWRKGELRFP